MADCWERRFYGGGHLACSGEDAMKKILSFKDFKKMLEADSDGETLPDQAVKTKKELKRRKNIETTSG